MSELLSTKLYIPRPWPGMVSRPRLTERLNAGLDRKLTLISAPAGFGKTTLLTEWIPLSPHCVTWLSLDEGDNDPTRFWAYVMASLQQIHADLGRGALALLQSPQAPSITAILTALINDIAAFPDRFATVLDDYHVVDSQTVDEALAYLIDHLPENFHLVISTRVDPALPLARLRARDHLAEFRANDLRSTADESVAFLTGAMGLSLSAQEVYALETRTEGWIAGLQLAALSMQGRDDIPGFIQSFSGSHRHILGFLAEEVLNQRPKGTLDFLLQTSILDRLCGPLCDAITEKSGGQEILEKLELANLFITPLDDQGVWYRYHHLFSEVLKARLQQTQPDQVHELHRRAGIWFASQGMIEEAVRHALAGGDYEEAARLIEAVAGDMLRRGSSVSLIRWLDAMPEETIRARPRLCLARGWTFVWSPRFHLESAKEWARLALQVALADGSLKPYLTGEVAALQAMIAAIRSEVARSGELSRQALNDLPLDSPWRSVMTFILGTARFYSDELVTATPVLDEAIKLSQADGARYIQLIAANFVADIQVLQGHLGRATEMYQQVLTWADHGLPQKGAVMAHGGLANILCEQDQLDDALAHVQLGAEQLEQVGGPGAALWIYRALARVHYAQGNLTSALEVLDLAYQSGQSAHQNFVVAQAAALRAGLQLAQDDLGAAEIWAANSGLSSDDPDASHPGLREVEYLSLARVLHAQGRHAEALSLLDRLMGSAQAEERHGSTIAILAFQSLVYQMQGNTARALECLERALTLAEPEGYVRTFLDEGEPMKLLMDDFRLTIAKRKPENPRLSPYVDRLLSAFAGEGLATPDIINDQQSAISTLVDPLSERELEVLRLIQAGFNNQEIAERLVIATSTVKTHINNLYTKFSVHSRTQAVAIARELGLFSD